MLLVGPSHPHTSKEPRVMVFGVQRTSCHGLWSLKNHVPWSLVYKSQIYRQSPLKVQKSNIFLCQRYFVPLWAKLATTKARREACQGKPKAYPESHAICRSDATPTTFQSRQETKDKTNLLTPFFVSLSLFTM